MPVPCPGCRGHQSLCGASNSSCPSPQNFLILRRETRTSHGAATHLTAADFSLALGRSPHMWLREKLEDLFEKLRPQTNAGFSLAPWPNG